MPRSCAFYLAHVAHGATPELAKLQAAWEKARVEHIIAADAIPGTMVFKDLPVPRDSFVMLRGQYDKKGEKVLPGTPSASATEVERSHEARDSARPRELDRLEGEPADGSRRGEPPVAAVLRHRPRED